MCRYTYGYCKMPPSGMCLASAPTAMALGLSDQHQPFLQSRPPHTGTSIKLGVASIHTLVCLIEDAYPTFDLALPCGKYRMQVSVSSVSEATFHYPGPSQHQHGCRTSLSRVLDVSRQILSGSQSCTVVGLNLNSPNTADRGLQSPRTAAIDKL